MTDIVVVGGGAIGGITAAHLAGAIDRVVVLDTNAAHVERLRDPGLRFTEEGEEHVVPLEAVTSADHLEGEFDFALVAVKSPFHHAALEPLVATGKVRDFVSLGNGLIQDRMQKIVGEGNLLSCIVEWGGDNIGPGEVVRDTVAPMVVGELDGEERDRTRQLATALEAVGDVRITPNLRGAIWSKLLVNSAFTGLSAISGLRYGGVADHPDGRTAAYAIWREGVTIGEHLELRLESVLDVTPQELYDRDDTALKRLMKIAGNTRPSMLQDLEQGRDTEVDVVNGGVAGKGDEYGIETPFNDGVVAIVHDMEGGERRPAPEELTKLVSSARS